MSAEQASNGFTPEIVMLDGSDKGLTDEDLEKFVSSFPVEPLKARGEEHQQAVSRAE